MNTLVAPTDTASLWAIITIGTALSIYLEQTYRWAARLSGPVIALLIAMLLSNTRVVPMESPAYDFIGDWLVPLAIPLLLLRADIRQIIVTGGRMFFIFHIASVGTLLGIVIAVVALQNHIPPADMAQASGLMAASYIGGGVNFFAIQATYNISGNIAAPLLVADNLIMAAFFILILAIAASNWFLKRYPHPHIQAAQATTNTTANRRTEINILHLATSLAVAFAILAIAMAIRRATTTAFGDVSKSGALVQMLQTLCTNRFVLLTAASLLVATLFPKPLAKINGPEEIGSWMLALFLFSIGLPADLMKVITETPIYFLFCAIIAIANVAFTLVVGRLLKLNLEELLLAMNATLGGPPTAAAMAASANWPKLVIPALLAGLWGYIIGTPIGILTIELLRR